MPVKIEGSADGRTSLASLAVQPSRSTRPTFRRSRSIDATPTAVLISVGHSEHSMTVKAEMTKLLAKTGSTLVIVADTTMVTIGSQASGLTGFMIWMIEIGRASCRERVWTYV